MSLVPVSGAVSGLQWAQLIVFAVEAPVMTLNLLTHNANGALGWFFLQNFCLLRAIGYIMIKVATSASLVKVGSILSQVALSTLFFGFFGVWHECTASTRHKRPFLFGWTMQIVLHLAVGTAIGLVIAGALGAVDDQPTAKNPKPGDNIVVAGLSIFVITWMVLCVLVTTLNKTAGMLNLEKKLLLVLTFCTPLLGIRVLYSLLGAAIDNSTWGFLTGGTIAEQVLLAALPEFVIIISLSIAGVMTRHPPQNLTASGSRQRQGRSAANGYGMRRV